MDSKQVITIFGILTVILGLGIGGFFAYQKGFLFSKPDPTIEPKKVKITNVSNDQFTVSWVTDVPTLGSIIYSKSTKLDLAQIDDTDQLTGQPKARKMHYVTIANLDAATTYNFKIRSGEKQVVYDNNGQPFTVKTASVLGTQPSSDIINGIVIDKENRPAVDAIVFITVPGVTPLSTQVKKDGSWLVKLSSSRSLDLASYASYDPKNTVYEILVQGETLNSKATINTDNDSPVPQIVLGETYDFTKDTALPTPPPQVEIEESTPSSELVSSPEATSSARTPENLVETPEMNPLYSDVTILNPTEEFERITTATPEIIGTGPEETVLTLRLTGPTSITASTVVDIDGSWTYTPSRSLTNGDYTITVDYTGDDGENYTVERSFIIAASATGGNTIPAFTASSSAQTATTSSSRRAMPSTSSGVPTSGVEIPTLVMLLLGTGCVVTGYGWKKRNQL